MSLSTKANQIAGPAVTGSSATTDPAFQPQLIMLWNGAQASTGAAAGTQMNIGMASGAAQGTIGYNSQNGVATSSSTRFISNAAVVANKNFAATTALLAATRTSLDASGFTTNWGTLGVTSPLYNYLALGGSDITNVAVGQYALSTTTGNQSVTGLGFKPDIVLFTGQLATTNTQSQNATQLGFGVMDGAGHQWSICQMAQHAVNPSHTNHAFSNTSCLVLTQTGANGFAHKQAFVSMDAGGFTVNIGTALGTASLVNYIAIKGGQWFVGNDTQKTSTGTKATTGTGFQPAGLILGSVCDTGTDVAAINARYCLGATTGTSNNVCIWTGDTSAVTPTVASTITSATTCLTLATEAASPTTNAAAVLSSFDVNGFTLNWTTADATARVFGYVAFTANAVVASTVAPTHMMMGMGT